MVQIGRSEFASTLAADGGRLRVDDLPREVLTELRTHGVDRRALDRIAGEDHVISGEEFDSLFDALAQRSVGSGRTVSESVFRTLEGRIQRDEQPDTEPVDAGMSARSRTTGIMAEPAREQETERTSLGWDERRRDIGTEEVLTHTRIDPATHDTARAIAALEPSGERGHVRVQAYLDAIEARDQRARLEAAGDRRGAAAIRQPEGVPAEIWNVTAALERQGISTDDVSHYLATGALPDLYDQNGEVVMTGDQRMEQLEHAAVDRGSWTAVNSFTFLVGMRRSAMGAERQAAAQVGGADIETALEQSRTVDRDLGRGLQSIYQSATLARERTGRGLIDRAARLEGEAATARQAGNTTRAGELEAEAQRLRDRGASITFREAEYRASMRSTRADAGRLYRASAEAQISTGETQIRQMVTSRGTLPETPPAVLGNDDGTNTGNGVPGAERLLGSARTTDPNAAGDDSQLSLESRRSGALAVFHREHLERGHYFDRVPASGQPAVRTDALVGHRSAYLDSRVDQARIATERIDVAAAEPAGAARDMRIAALESERRGVADEMAGALGQSFASDRRVTEDRERASTLTQQAADAQTQLADARTAAGEAGEGVTRAHDGADAVFGDTFKTSGEARRDREGISDAEAIDGIEGGRLRLAEVNQRDTARASRSADAALRRSELQATRDGQDAELVAQAMDDFPATERVSLPPPASMAEAYDRARGLADHAAGQEAQALTRAAGSLPRGGDREVMQASIAERRVDLSRYWTRSAEGQVVALGEEGRADATDRLDTASMLIDSADRTRGSLPAGSDRRESLAARMVEARSELAVANADYRPEVSRDQLAAAELATSDLERVDLADEAHGQIGRAATVSLARSDQRFEAILDDGNYVPGAADDLYTQAHRMLDDRHLPNTQENRDARELLGRFDRAIETVDDMLDASGAQLRRGQSYAEARTRQLGHAEIQAAQAQVSTVISGGAFIISFGQFDMKDDMAEAGEDATGWRLHWIRQDGARLDRGQQDMATSWASARDSGRPLEWIHAVRIFSDRSRRDTMPETYGQAFATIDGGLSADRSRAADWQDFNRTAIREGHVPVARALSGQMLAFEEAHRSLGDERIMAVTPNMQDMIQSQADSLRETTDGMMWIIGINTALEVGLGLVLTGGVGSAASVAEAGNALNTARTAASAVNAARTATLALRAMAMARTAGTVTLVGGGMMAANYGVGRLVGRNTGVARGFETLTNFIPIGAGHRAAGLGRSLTTIGLGSAQAFATTVATPHVARWTGLERSELGQAAIGLGLNVLFSTGVAGAARPRAAMADHLLRTASTEPGNTHVRDQVRVELDTFSRDTQGRVPTEAETGALRTRLYERLGLTEGAADVGERRAMVDGAIEAMRIERAAHLGATESADPRVAVQIAGDRLFAARGGEQGGTSRAQAYRDAAMGMGERLVVEAQQALDAGDTARATQLMETRAMAGEQSAATGIVDATAREAGQPQRAQAEAIVSQELTGARHAIDAPDGNGLNPRDASVFYDRVARRLVDEAHLSPDEARATVDAMRGEIMDQAVVRHLAAAQDAAGERPLSHAEVERIGTDLARRGGAQPPGQFGRGLVENRAVLEQAGILRQLPADAPPPVRFDGPDPVVEAPPARDLARAQARLQALRPGEQLSTRDTEVLLQHAAYSSRHAIQRAQPNAADPYSAQCIAGACGFGQAATSFTLQSSGIPASRLHPHQANAAFPSQGAYSHAFLVAEMPNGKRYLVDTTFRQFFHPDYRRPNELGHPGELMRQTPEGSRIADELIRNGYVELTDTVAREYGRALSSGEVTNTRAADLLRPTTTLDYARSEFDGMLPEAPVQEATSRPAEPLRAPARRHDLLGVRQGTVAKDWNTVVEPGVDVAADVRAINEGRAVREGDTYRVNGRTYGHHDGTLYPMEGPGLHRLDRGAFKALGVYNEHGMTPRAEQILDRMRMSDAARAQARAAYEAGHP